MNRQNSSRAEYSRSTPTALVIAASVILLIAALYWAQAILIPVALAMLLAFLLTPGVTAMQQTGVGRIPSAMLIVVLTFLVLATVGWAVSSEIMSLAGELPKYQDNIKQKIHDLRGVGKGSALEKVQDTVDEVKSELEKDDKSRKLQKQPRSVIVQPESSWRLPFNFGPLAEGLASVGLVVALLIFMLVQREELRNRLIRLVGYSKLTVTTKALEEAAQRISRYLLMQTLINSFFGLTVAIALFLIDLPYAFLWGFLAALLRFVPYLGVWIAAAMPTALSLAVFREWGWPLAVIGIFVVLELIIYMLVEPLLYGESAGISQVGLLVTVAFWTWLWGPIGLVLATPLTVCLVVFAKHVPQLEFVRLLLSDEPVMEAKFSYYQRLLAMDQDEAGEIVEEYLENHPREQVYDEVLLPALSYAKRDRRRNNLTLDEEQFIVDTTRKLLENLNPSERQTTTTGDGSQNPGESRAKVRILGCSAHGEADEIGLLMLRQLLDSGLYVLEISSGDTLTGEVISRVREEDPSLVCIGAQAQGGLAQTRHLCKRLRGEFPELKIVVGRWGVRGEADELRKSLLSAGADHVATSLLETRDQIRNLRPLISDSDTVQTDNKPGSTEF